MGIINAGTGFGGIVAPPFIAAVIGNISWFGISPWRWVFLLTGAFGLFWTVWWALDYFTPSITSSQGNEALISCSPATNSPNQSLVTSAATFHRIDAPLAGLIANRGNGPPKP